MNREDRKFEENVFEQTLEDHTQEYINGLAAVTNIKQLIEYKDKLIYLIDAFRGQPLMLKQIYKKIILIAHPDKNDSSEESNTLTQWITSQFSGKME